MKKFKVFAQFQIWQDETVIVEAENAEQAQEKACQHLQDEDGAENIKFGTVEESK